MKTYEKESFLKTFSLFFSVQIIFLSIVVFQDYKKVFHEYEMHVGNEIMQCYMNKNCDKFQRKTLQKIQEKKVHTLYNDGTAYMLFKNNNKYVKVFISQKAYLEQQQLIQLKALLKYGMYLLVLLLVSLLFTFYTLRPLKQAMKLNEEFVKDILHDFNTPLASLNINYKILKKKFGKDDALQRSEDAIQNILSLQTNLHYFLSQSKLQKDMMDISKIVKEKVLYFQVLYPSLIFQTQLVPLEIYTNKSAFVRIIDNLLSNAGKYNKEDGSVHISLDGNILKIADTGRGIKNPKEIFERYYKENDTGIGIGLHIVKKLCDELDIAIRLETKINEGSTFSLDLNKCILSK